jgi:hypothetical protein
MPAGASAAIIPLVPDLRWSPSAARLVAVLRARSSYARLIEAREAISAIAGDTLPGDTVTGQALLDASIWPGAQRLITGRLRTDLSTTSANPIHVDGLVVAAIEDARADSARKVGERHVMTALWRLGAGDMHHLELNRDRLLEKVRELELGAPFDPGQINGRWHGLVDTNAVIHFKDLHAIDWRAETGQPAVTIWGTTVLLDELDDLAFEAGPRSRARQRARVLNRWLKPHIREAMEPTGYEMRDRVRLRLWVPPVSARPPDGQHLDAAEELLDRGVPIHVVTNDNGMIARAIARELDVLQLSEGALVEDTEGPH